MKKSIVVTAGLLLSVFLLSGAVFAWQGRMAGMSDPLGLVEDESDFLTNPAKLADGQGVKYYGDYRFTYSAIMDWNWNTNQNNSATPSQSLKHSTGNEFDHDVLLGAAFPLGAGRMGIFFDYAGKRGAFDGQANNSGTSGSGAFSFFSATHSNSTAESDVDNFGLRVLYAQPVSNKTKIGAEFDITHYSDDYSTGTAESIAGIPGTSPGTNQFVNLQLPFLFPHSSNYWELLGKVGLESDFNLTKLGATVRGGGIVSGSNDLTGQSSDPFVTNGPFAIPSKTDGWKVGGDMWLRQALSDCIALPLLVRVDYSQINRYGNGAGGSLGGFLDPPLNSVPAPFGASQPGHSYTLNNVDKLLQIEAGGGVDWALSKSSRVAAGIYYDYINSESSMVVNTLASDTLLFNFVYDPLPGRTEHLARFKLAGETQLTPQWTVRAGLDVFGGSIHEDMGTADVRANFGPTSSTFNGSLDGTHWGISGSFGATTRCMGLTMEPWVMGGYQEVSLDDSNASGTDGFQGRSSVSWNTKQDRNDMVVAAGFSILF